MPVRGSALLVGTLIVAAVAACGTSEPNELLAHGSRPLPGDPANASPAAEGLAQPATAMDLPCEVARVFGARCTSCHAGASPARLLSHQDLLGPSGSQPGKTLAQTSIERVKSPTLPMPPEPDRLTADEIAVLESWAAAGFPKGAACASPVEGPPGPGPYDTPVVCTSKRTYSGGDEGDDGNAPTMYPGRACVGCHSREDGPRFVLSGTVYPTAHEPDDCAGTSGQVAVVVSDVAGSVLRTIPVNGAGNFFANDGIQLPFRVKIVRNGVERAMAGVVTSGDCNSCHTERGTNGAPGRIMAP